MDILLLVTMVLVLGLVAGQEEARAWWKVKECPSKTVNRYKLFKQWTEMDTGSARGKPMPIADAQCWFDLNRCVLYERY